MPSVSVIIPCYNRADLIGETLASVMAQTQPVQEVLVVDDGSTDATCLAVEEWARKSGGLVRLLRQENGGPSRARNHGLREATGKYVAFLDADDLWLPEKIAQQTAFLETPDHGQFIAVYNRMFKFQKTLDDLNRAEPQNQISDPGVDHLVRTMSIQSSTTLIRRQAAEGVWFDEAIRAAEDALYFAELRLRGRWGFIDAALTAYRVHEVQLTREVDHLAKTTLARVQWCRRMADQLGREQAATLEAELWRMLVNAAEKMYWRREVQHLPALVEQLGQWCPAELEKSVLARRKIYPPWVYSLWDGITGTRGRR